MDHSGIFGASVYGVGTYVRIGDNQGFENDYRRNNRVVNSVDEYYSLNLKHIQYDDKSGSFKELEAPLVVVRAVTPLMQKSVLPNLERSILLDDMWSDLKGRWLEERRNHNG